MDTPTLEDLARHYLKSLEIRGYMKSTIQTRRSYLRWFFTWCHETGRTCPDDFHRTDIEAYREYLSYHRRETDGQPLCPESRKKRFFAVTDYFTWLEKTDLIPTNPAEGVPSLKGSHRPKTPTLTIEEVERILAQPDIEKPLGLRNRAVLETLYSTGLRRSELAGVKLTDVDHGQGLIYVHQAKGGGTRFVPIGERALKWIDQYLLQVRPHLAAKQKDPHLFLGRSGKALTAASISSLAGRYKQEADISKRGAGHLFRHTAATLMLEGGADMVSVQTFLGHQKLQTTEIYTHVTKEKLREIYLQTHPSALNPDPQLD